MPPLVRAVARAHILELAEEHSILVRWTKRRWAAEAHATTRQAWCPPLRRLADYLIGLHELGHIAAPLAVLTRPGLQASIHDQLVCEASAWGWAFDQADLELLDGMEARDWDLLADAMISHPLEAVTTAQAARSAGS